MKQEFLLDVTLQKGSDLTRIASLWDICHYYVTRFMGFKCLTLKEIPSNHNHLLARFA